MKVSNKLPVIPFNGGHLYVYRLRPQITSYEVSDKSGEWFFCDRLGTRHCAMCMALYLVMFLCKLQTISLKRGSALI